MKGLKRKILLAILSFAVIFPTIGVPVMAGGSTKNWNISISGGAAGSMAVDTTVAKSGNASMKLVNKTPVSSNVYVRANTTVPLTAGKKYDVIAYVKADKTENLFLMMEDWTKRYSLTMFSNTYDWSNFEFTYTATKTNEKAIVGFLFEGITEVWIDDFQIIDKETGENIVENSDFEGGIKVSDDDVADGKLENLYETISNSESFSKDDIESVRGAFKYMPVYVAEDIMIDGKGDDWGKYPEMAMPTLSTQYQVYIDDSKPKDVDARAKFAQDDEAIYIYIEVIDDIYVYEPGSGYWKGDSIQMTLSTTDEVYGNELGFTFNPKTGLGEIYGSGFSENQRNRMILRASRSETTTIYEAKIPWDTKFEIKPEKFLFNFLINDNDGEGRRYCAQLAPGISEGKINTEFPLLENLEGQKDWYAWVEGPRDTITESEQEFDCYIVNGDNDKTFTIECELTGTKETVMVPANKGIRLVLKKTFDVPGEYNISVDFINADDKYTFDYDVSVTRALPSEKYVNDFADKLEKNAKELDRLIKKCQSNDINPEYEIINKSIIERFARYVREDLENNDISRIYYTEETCNTLYEKAKSNLNAYLNGEKKPLNVPRYITSNSRAEGLALYSMTELNGRKEERPVFFVGYGHFDEVKNDVPVFKNFGVNSIQQEIGPSSCVTGTEEFTFNPNAASVAKMLDTLKSCEENNISISLLLSPHYMSESLIKQHNMAYSDTAFLKYNVNHPVAKKVIEAYLRGIIPIVKDYKCIRNICISNEPHFNSSTLPEFYEPLWQDWLKEKYGDIKNLNNEYKETYTSFDEVDMSHPDTAYAKTYDYKLFNDEIFSDWHKFMADIIKELAPDIPLQAKITGYTGSNKKFGGLIDGVGYEYYYEFLDYNGCDFWNVLDDTQEPLVKEMYYDYLLSFKEAPIINSEDHHITDGSKDFYPLELSDYVAQDVYMGAIHGRAESDLWVWSRTNNLNSGLRDSILYRPDAIAKVGYAALDLNRLAYEIVAMQNEPAEVGIVFSNADMLYNDLSMHAAYSAYEAVLYNGQKARFVLDINPELMNKYKLVIVPATVYMTDRMLNTLEEYIRNGGKVFVMNNCCFSKNEHGFERNPADFEYILNNATVISYQGSTQMMTNMTKEELSQKVREALINANAYYVKVIDEKTGEPAHNIEYNVGVNGDKVIINLSNIGESTSVKIFAGNKQIKEAVELRSGIKMNEAFDVGKYSVITLESDIENKFIDTYGHWAEEDILFLSDKKIINGVSNSRYVPQGTTSRAEFITLLTLAAGLGGSEYKTNVPDVNSDDWFAPYVESAIKAGIINSGEFFRPNDKITREEMCEMLINCYEYANGKVMSETEINFTDVKDIINVDTVTKAVSLGLMFGMDDGRFAPQNTATRAESAAVIARYIR